MPLRVGTSSGSTVPTDIRVGSVPVLSVIAATSGGPVELWRRTESTVAAFIAVTSSTSLTVPAWATVVDVVAIGGGGGGHGGYAVSATDGKGGGAGGWEHRSQEVTPGGKVTITVGSGGAAEKAGGETTVTLPPGELPGSTTFAATGGGASASGTSTGGTPPGYTAFGVTFSGGAGGARDTAGSAPGGGGGGGQGFTFNYNPGKPGGRGQAWIRFRSY